LAALLGRTLMVRVGAVAGVAGRTLVVRDSAAAGAAACLERPGGALVLRRLLDAAGIV
tara:strand:+ start:1561 stop:1734 length:174 start_codon:yes stop_codon:yes gene_type:complete